MIDINLLAATIERNDSDSLKSMIDSGKVNVEIYEYLLEIALKVRAIECADFLMTSVVLSAKKIPLSVDYNMLVLDFACRSGSINMLKFVLEQDFILNDEVILNLLKPLTLKDIPWTLEISTVLVGYITNINYCDSPENNKNFLYYACAYGNIHMVRALLIHGANPNICGTSGSALAVAASTGHDDVVDLLLSWETTPIAYDILKRALLYSVVNGHESIVDRLVQYLRKCNALVVADLNGLLPNAAMHPSVTAVLLNNGADVNYRFEDGRCLLEIAPLTR